MVLTEEQHQRLKSGLYNANSTMQHLRTTVASLESTVRHQNGNILMLNQRLEELEDKLR